MTESDIRAIIDRVADALGPNASPAQVEEVARAVMAASGGASAADRQPGGPEPHVVGDGPISGRIVVTAFGCDQPGILAAVTSELRDLKVNVLDVSQKILQDYFTLILLADLEGSGATPGRVQERLSAHAQRLGVRILVQHEELFHAMRRI
jgi:ACT domain-containing protein